MKPFRPNHAALLAFAACGLFLLGTAHAQTYYGPADDASRYRYAGESDSQYEARVRRHMERQEARRRANPGPGLPSMEQQKTDQEAAVREAYSRQQQAPLTRGNGSRSNNTPRVGR